MRITFLYPSKAIFAWSKKFCLKLCASDLLNSFVWKINPESIFGEAKIFICLNLKWKQEGNISHKIKDLTWKYFPPISSLRRTPCPPFLKYIFCHGNTNFFLVKTLLTSTDRSLPVCMKCIPDLFWRKKKRFQSLTFWVFFF